MPPRLEFCCDHVDNSFFPLPRVLSSTRMHPPCFLWEVIHIFFFRHIATEAECLALAKEGWGFVQLSVRKASLFDWRRASGFAYFCLERRERERRERGRKREGDDFTTSLEKRKNSSSWWLLPRYTLPWCPFLPSAPLQRYSLLTRVFRWTSQVISN